MLAPILLLAVPVGSLVVAVVGISIYLWVSKVTHADSNMSKVVAVAHFLFLFYVHAPATTTQRQRRRLRAELERAAQLKPEGLLVAQYTTL